MLTLIGLGLCDAKDITLRGKEAIDLAGAVYLEGYTSLLQCTHEELETALGKKIALLLRHDVELNISTVLEQAKNNNVCILVIGDVFAATTHADLYLRAQEQHIDVRVIHNTSILTAIGSLGLELYRYGKTVSIPYWMQGFEPTSFLDGIQENYDRGLHTLCLLDIKSDEHRFMTVNEAIAYLLKAEEEKKTGIVTEKTLVVGVARLGCPDQNIVAGSLSAIKSIDFGKPPHSLVIPGKLHSIEEEMLQLWKG